MGACQWTTTIRALLCLGVMGRRPKPWRKRLPGKPSITYPTLLGHWRGCGLRQSVSSSSPTPVVRPPRSPASVREDQPWTTPSTISAATRSSTCGKDTENGCARTSRPCRTRWTCACSIGCRRSTGLRRTVCLIWHVAPGGSGRGSGSSAPPPSMASTSRRKCLRWREEGRLPDVARRRRVVHRPPRRDL